MKTPVWIGALSKGRMRILGVVGGSLTDSHIDSPILLMARHGVVMAVNTVPLGVVTVWAMAWEPCPGWATDLPLIKAGIPAIPIPRR